MYPTRTTTLLVLVILGLLLGGCANYYASRPDVDRRVQQWLAEDRYGLAIDTIQAMKPEHPQYRRMRETLPRIRARARAYAERVSKEALQLAQQHKWAEALSLYDEGLAHYPESRLLRNERDRFLRDREQWLAMLDRKWLQLQGEWLLKALPLQRRIVRTNPADDHQQERLKALEKLREETAAGLRKHGMAALEKGNFVLAGRLLGLANELKPDPATRIALSRIQTHGIRADSGQREDTEKRLRALRRQQARQYQGYFDEAFRREDWLEARAYLQELRRLMPDTRAVSERARKLQKAIDREVERLIELGERQYSQGEFEQALKTWEQARPLAPGHRRLAEDIARARRVLANLKKLEGRPPLVEFPVEPKAGGSDDAGAAGPDASGDGAQ